MDYLEDYVSTPESSFNALYLSRSKRSQKEFRHEIVRSSLVLACSIVGLHHQSSSGQNRLVRNQTTKRRVLDELMIYDSSAVIKSCINRRWRRDEMAL